MAQADGGDGTRDSLLPRPECPGCKVSDLRSPNAKVPVKLLFYLGCILLANCLPISSLYPFVYFMVKDFHVAKSDESIGYWAGWIGSSFMIGRACSGIVWGAVADRYGRKPVMYCGLASVLVLNTLFGLSSSFWMALVIRFLLGGFNGMLGTLKAYASEICNEEHQALGQGVVGTCWGLGLIVGPALGGYLARPAVKYPNTFTEGSLFQRYPYLLQALCTSAFSFFALFMCAQLPETLHKNHRPKQAEVDYEDPKKGGSRTEQEQRPDESLYKNWPFIAVTIMYCLWSLHDIAYTEVFSLWAVSPKSYGGLSFSSSDVGLVLAVAGFAMLVFQLSLYPFVAKRLGVTVTSRLGALLTIPLLCTYPLFSKLEGFWLHLTVFSASILKYILTVGTMTGSFVMINNTVRQHQRGAANGLALSVVSIFKGIGPASAGIVFAWAQTRLNASVLPGDQLVFFFLNLFAALTVLSTLEPFLPSSAQHVMQEDE